MKFPVNKLILFLSLNAALSVLRPQFSSGLTFEFPDQKLMVGYSSASITRTVGGKLDDGSTGSRSDELSASFGFGAEYTLFITNRLGLSGQFALHRGGTTTQGTVLLGGGGGISWYVLGGAIQTSEDDYVKSKVSPNLNLNVDFGLSAKSFNFEPFIEPPAPGTVETSFDNDVDKGSVFGFYVGAGVEYPVAGFLPGFRVQYISAFEDAALPALTILEMWLTAGFLL